PGVDVRAVELDGVLKHADEHIANSRSTIVVEIVVSIETIFWQGIPLKEIVYTLLLLGRQVEHLFMDEPILIHVHARERLVIPDSELIVQVSPRKIKIKIRLIEIEYPIVVRFVNLLPGIIHAQGAVTEGGV